MSEWTQERIREQQRLTMSGRAGVWIMLEGGPRNGTRGFIPHVDWPFFVLIDAEGADVVIRQSARICDSSRRRTHRRQLHLR